LEGQWLLWQLGDSAFPTGGFAHSGGLEAAWQHGEVGNAADLASFLEASLWQMGRGTLLVVTAAHDDANQLASLDDLSEAFLSNHVAKRASQLQGRAFLASVVRIFAVTVKRPVNGHFAPIFGAVTAALGVTRAHTARLFCFQYLRSLLSAAVRIGIVGPMEAQTLQHQLSPRVREVLLHCEKLPIEEIAQTAPLLEIWQGRQDHLYSRLFQT
jgi:urease accessory protein